MTDFYNLPLGDRAPEEVNAVVEIPAGSRNKYEYSSQMQAFRLDRVLSASMVYVGDYGFVPRTLAGDGDPVDALILVENPTFTGCVVPVRPVGLMKMDDKGEDYKVLCVPAGDKRCGEVADLVDVAPHRLKEIEHFFRSYKSLDGSFPAIDGWFPAAQAKEYLMRCARTYADRHP